MIPTSIVPSFSIVFIGAALVERLLWLGIADLIFYLRVFIVEISRPWLREGSLLIVLLILIRIRVGRNSEVVAYRVLRLHVSTILNSLSLVLDRCMTVRLPIVVFIVDLHLGSPSASVRLPLIKS